MADLTIPDITAFGRGKQTLAGSTPVGELPRVAADASADSPVEWRIEGEIIERSDAPEYAGQVGLRLHASAVLRVACARCLEPRRAEVTVERRYAVFETDEAADAAPLDDDRFDPVVARRSLDLRELLEDELLLAVDPAGVHESCPPEALARLGLVPVDEGVARIEEAPSAFDVLRNLRQSRDEG